MSVEILLLPERSCATPKWPTTTYGKSTTTIIAQPSEKETSGVRFDQFWSRQFIERRRDSARRPRGLALNSSRVLARRWVVGRGARSLRWKHEVATCLARWILVDLLRIP
jgi:hypothetical protein